MQLRSGTIIAPQNAHEALTSGMFTTFPTAVAPMGPDHLLFYYF